MTEHDTRTFCDFFPDGDVPSDLKSYYRQFKPGLFGYVCPCCKNVFAPGWGGMPGSFRAHIREYLEGAGCFFNPRAKAVAKSDKHSKEAAGF